MKIPGRMKAGTGMQRSSYKIKVVAVFIVLWQYRRWKQFEYVSIVS